MDDHPARSLNHRFHDERCDFLVMSFEDVSHAVQALNIAVLPAPSHRTAIAIRGVSAQDREAHHLESFGERRIGAYRHRAGGIAMIGMIEGDNFRASRLTDVAPVLHSHLKRHFNRG